MINLKRVYEGYTKEDGFRVLVDRLWPRGLSKEKAHVDLWIKETAPSDKLRKWFSHEPARWPEFKKEYFKELAVTKENLKPIMKAGKKNNVTLLYAAKDGHFNNAVALKEYIMSALRRKNA